MSLRLLPLALAATLLPEAALGCSPLWEPFSKRLRSLEKRELAIKAEATVHFTTYSESRWTGTVTFDRIKCIKGSGQKPCPRRLQVAFDHVFDGADCGSPLGGSRPGEPPPFRYFILSRPRGEAWRLTHAFASYSGG